MLGIPRICWLDLRRTGLGVGAEFTRRHRPLRVAYTEEFSDETPAVRREHQLKRWSRAKKQALIAGRLDRIHEFARRRRR